MTTLSIHEMTMEQYEDSQKYDRSLTHEELENVLSEIETALGFSVKFVATNGHHYIRPTSNLKKFTYEQEGLIKESLSEYGIDTTKEGVKANYTSYTIKDGMGFRIISSHNRYTYLMAVKDHTGNITITPEAVNTIQSNEIITNKSYTTKYTHTNKLIKLLSVITLTLSISTLAACSTQSSESTKQPNTIKQSYTVTDVHQDYITASSNKYNNELINFYYDDQINKQHFNTNDKLVAYFKPYKNSYQIIDFKKEKAHIITESFQVTSINNHQYTATSTTNSADKPRLIFTSDKIEGNKHININDNIAGYYVEAGKEDIFFKVVKNK